jgi:hypothetical protein
MLCASARRRVRGPMAMRCWRGRGPSLRGENSFELVMMCEYGYVAAWVVGDVRGGSDG